MIKNILRVAGRILVSGIIAFLGLSLFCELYYNLPGRIPDGDAATNYRWEPNTFYSRGTEGFAWGRTNNEGYINPQDYDPDEQIDILIIGSSHMEALQVPVNNSAAVRLSQLLPEDRVYNIGMSNHDFLSCIANYESALSKYHPTKCAVIEAVNLIFLDYELEQAIRGTTPRETVMAHSGLLDAIKQNHYLRLLYSQMESYRKAAGGGYADNADEISDSLDSVPKNNERLMGDLLEKLRVISETAGTRLIIAYHPKISINADGSLQVWADASTLRQFERLCEQHDIGFLDMSNRIAADYAEYHILPYGFINSAIGSGHFNAEGHAMFADELYQMIRKM